MDVRRIPVDSKGMSATPVRSAPGCGGEVRQGTVGQEVHWPAMATTALAPLIQETTANEPTMARALPGRYNRR